MRGKVREAEEEKEQAAQEEEQGRRTTGPTSWQTPLHFLPRPSPAEAKDGRWRRAMDWAQAAPPERRITWAYGRPTVGQALDQRRA